MPQHRLFAPIIWQLILMGLLGFSGVVFVPVLLRLLPAESIAEILVCQVAVYYLVLLVQYGFQWSGPAFLARFDSAAVQIAFWRRSIHTKFALLPVGTLLLISGVLWHGLMYLVVFSGLLIAIALNSNWFLQARRDFRTGVLAVFIGVLLAGLLICGMWLIRFEPWQMPLLAILVLILPQLLLGVGTWLAVTREAAQIPVTDTDVYAQLPQVISLLRDDFPVVLSQILLLGSTTLGTMVVGSLADVATTAAYAATERLFNLGATVIVGLYMVLYPRLAELFYQNPGSYVRALKQIFALIAASGIGVLVLIGLWGEGLLRLYLGQGLEQLVSPIVFPLGLWLVLCVSQHMLTGHLVYADRRSSVLSINLLILVVTVIVGTLAAQITPVYWIYGMVAGQIVALGILVKLGQQSIETTA